jgi:hypothetical protein
MGEDAFIHFLKEIFYIIVITIIFVGILLIFGEKNKISWILAGLSLIWYFIGLLKRM